MPFPLNMEYEHLTMPEKNEALGDIPFLEASLKNMEVVKEETTIVSRIDEVELIRSHSPEEFRLAHIWLSIEKEMKGQKWFLKECVNKGVTAVVVEEGKYRWVYETKSTVTLDDTPPDGHHLELWKQLNSQNPPYLVKLLKAGINHNISYALRELWQEIEAA